MPFCSSCGTEVSPTQAYCRNCGASQPVGSATGVPPIANDPFAGISPRTASILCYIPGLGWIAAIIVLAAHRSRQMPQVRFHAFQGLYLFVAWLMNDQVLKWALAPVPQLSHLHDLVSVVLLIMSIFMMVKASHDEAYALPLFGELAQRSMSEN